MKTSKQLKVCAGFERICKKPANSRFSIFYCDECDEKRIAQIMGGTSKYIHIRR